MLSMDVTSTHSMAHVRREARRFFVEERGFHQEDTPDASDMFFTGGDGFVRVELSSDGGSARVVLHSRDLDDAIQEFARLIS